METIENILQKMNKMSCTELAAAKAKMNIWELPVELFENAPATFTVDDEYYHLVSYAMDLIKIWIGEKECSREWNKDEMNNEEFETWWNSESTQGYIKKYVES